MKHIQVSLLAICLFLSAGYAQQIQNIQFKDMKGKSYNLYTALGEGKSVLVHSTWTE